MRQFLTFRIPGKPQPKQRARSGINAATGRKVHYTPEATKNFEEAVRLVAYNARITSPGASVFFHGPVALSLSIDMKIPGSWPKWKQDAAFDGFIAPTVDPDASNVVKAVEDGLNGVVWRDDNQVVKLEVSMQYSDCEGVTVKIESLDQLTPKAKRADYQQYMSENF